MKPDLIGWIACPGCRSRLELGIAEWRGPEIERGTLTCVGCHTVYQIVRGIPRLLPPSASAEAESTAERFGYEWSRFPEIRPEYEAQFAGWIAPVTLDDFRDRVVLDAGCGKGRHLRIAASSGARAVIGLDLGPAIDVAAQNTRDLPNVHLVQGDLSRPPLADASIDVVYSIGVLHHLEDPAAGFRGLAPLLVDDGMLVAWLYGREGNGWVLTLVDPVRRVTRRMPLPLVRALSWILTLPLWLALRALYAPGRRHPWLGRRLPYRSYLFDLLPFPFREVHSIAFDQLLAPVAHYMRREDVERCFAEGGLEVAGLRWHHRNSWAAHGRHVSSVGGRTAHSTASVPRDSTD